MGYSKRCNQSTRLNSATEKFISHHFVFKTKPLPHSTTLAIPFSPENGHAGVFKRAWTTISSGSYLCRSLAGRTPKANRRAKLQPFLHLQAILQEVSTHKREREMYARSKCQRNFFLSREKKCNISEPIKHLFGMFPASCSMFYSNTGPSISHSTFWPKQTAAHNWSRELSIYLFTLSRRFKKQKKQ